MYNKRVGMLKRYEVYVGVGKYGGSIGEYGNIGEHGSVREIKNLGRSGGSRRENA